MIIVNRDRDFFHTIGVYDAGGFRKVIERMIEGNRLQLTTLVMTSFSTIKKYIVE